MATLNTVTLSAAPDAEVVDLEGNRIRLSELWGNGLTALVFMRHAGCIFCRVQIKELRNNAANLERAGLSVVIITPDRPSRARKFVEEYRIPFPVLTDFERNAYIAYGLTEGGLGEFITPRVARRGVEAVATGNFIRRPGSNPRQLPGTAIVDRDGRLRHLHRAEDAADHLTSRDLIRLAQEIGAGSP